MPRVTRLAFCGKPISQESPHENGNLQGNPSVPNETFRSTQRNRIMGRQQLVCTTNRIALIKVRLPLPSI
ncbi:hypothetical protein A2U01_0042024 [Trifolium medium]|uniref:Uncharacterized protein n=1 Tax=Trifolium medium TaxID=97028 RepID=A0A392Q971_9FABA|nr:hypothetical protein [Trifolium medium]